MTTNETVFNKDLPNKKLTVLREFNAPPDLVWEAWTDSEILDQWWAPKPYRAATQKMDFREGGIWLYDMLGPEGITDGTTGIANRTKVQVIISFDRTADMETIITMGFQEGFNAGLGNLDSWFSAHFRLRGQAKTDRSDFSGRATHHQ